MRQLLFSVFLWSVTISGTAQSVGRFEIALPTFAKTPAFDGRILLFLSNREGAEPRFQVSNEVDSQQMFSMDVRGVRPGQSVMYDMNSSGYPQVSFAEIPAGDYYVQVLLQEHQTMESSDGKTVELPMGRREEQSWRTAPGVHHSKPVRIRFDPKSGKALRLKLD